MYLVTNFLWWCSNRSKELYWPYFYSFDLYAKLISYLYLYSHGKIWQDKKNQAKLDSTKLDCLILRIFLLLWPTFYFWRGDGALGSVYTQVWDFLDISQVPKFLSLADLIQTICTIRLIWTCKLQNRYNFLH